MSETKLDYEAARRCFECHSLVTDNGVVVGCEVVTDASECPACERNAARVGLELMGAWREVPRDWCRLWGACEYVHADGNSKSAIATRHGLPEIESSSKFRSDREATSTAQKALRSMAYENQDSGWSKFRCHARLPGQTKAF